MHRHGEKPRGSGWVAGSGIHNDSPHAGGIGLNLHENRILVAMRKMVNLWWWIAVALGTPCMIAMLSLITFAPGRLPMLQGAVMDFYGASALWTLPEGAIEATLQVTLARALYGLMAIEAPAAFITVYQLKKILENVVNKTPFVIENANRTRILGLTIIGAAVLRFVHGMVVGRIAENVVHLQELNLTVSPPFEQLKPVFFWFLVLLLAEVLRYGIRLQEDADLTV